MSKYNKTLAKEHLNKGHRVFTTDSPDNAILVVWNVSEKRLHRKGKIICSRLENTTYSLPFEQPHPLLNVKVKIIDELG